MRIALVAGPWLPVPPPAYGGTEGVIDRLATGFRDAGHDVLLFTTGDSTCAVPRASVRERAVPEYIGQSYVELHHLLHAYDEVADFDIIHDHTVLGPMVSSTRTTGQVVTTNHGPFTEEILDIFASSSRHAAVVAISHDQASRACGVPVSAVIHHGLRPQEWTVGQGDGDYLLFLGRFSPDKGAREAALIAHLTGVPLVMAAKMREREEVEYFTEHVKPLLGAQVEYVGEVGMEEKQKLLGSARALLNPILWPEPFGLVMIEALACGTPVLTLCSGAASEIVDHGVTGFVHDRVEDLAASVGRIDELDRAACRRAVEGRFSADRMVRDHLDLFEQLLGR